MAVSSSKPVTLDTIVAAYLADIDAGRPAPTTDELRARHPKFADELIAFFRDEASRLVADSMATAAFTPVSFDGFECLEELGRGGMGIVYRARDSRLGREVAIKVLRDEYANDPVWRSRFEREARLLASLNHSNVAIIHGVGEECRFLIMELIPGSTLADRIATGPLKVGEASGIAVQIAAALEAAHGKAIIHRDLKPANIKITPEGQIKVLDFGLARSSELPAGDRSWTNEGAIVGTAAYMSPEQARAERLDKRTDIWAFGCILFEMISGTRAFTGATITDCLAVVLKDDPDWTALPAELDSRLANLIRRCLRKDSRRRWHDIADVRIELEEIATTPVPNSAVTHWPTWHGELLLGRPLAVFQPSVSLEGQSLVYLQIDGRMSQIGRMNLNSGHRKLLTTDRDQGSAFHPCCSPDGAWVYFARADSAPRGVFRVSMTDDRCELVLENADCPQPLADGSLIAGRIGSDGQYRVVRYWSDSNRLAECSTPIVHLYDELNNFPSFQALPDGRSVACWRRPPGEAARVFLLDLTTGEGQYLDADIRMGALACGLAVSPDSNCVHVAHRLDGRQAMRIVAVPTDPKRATRTMLTFPGGSSGLTIDRAGNLYVSVTQPFSELLRFPRNAKPGTQPERLTEGGVDWEVPTALPDGRILFAETAAGRHRLVTVKDGGRSESFGPTSEDTWLPAALLDERRIAIGIGPGHARDIAIVDIKSGRILHRHRLGLSGLTSLTASSDGTLYFGASHKLYALGKNDEAPRPIGDCTSAALSHDGDYLLAICPTADGPCLRRIPLNGDSPSDVPIHSDTRLHHLPITGNAIGSDGRALVLTMPNNSYFNVIALVDPNTGNVEPIELNYEGDLFAPTHGTDGTVLAVGRPFQSEIWRFRSLS